MPHTDKGSVLALYIQNLIDTNKASLGVDTVLYGDQNKIPPGVTVCVTMGVKDRQLAGVAFPGGRTQNDMLTIIEVYNNKTQSEANGRLETDQTAEAIEDLLHQNTTMGGLIYHGYVRKLDPGISYRSNSNSMFRSAMLTFVGQSKTNLTVP